MVNPIDFTNGMVEALRRCPELVSHLEPPAAESIYGYIDELPERNSIESAKYAQRPGSVMVVWIDARLTNNAFGMPVRAHHAEIYVKAQRGQSSLQLITDVMNGVPTGENEPWHYCPFVDGVEKTTPEPQRVQNPENIDLMMVATETFETGTL